LACGQIQRTRKKPDGQPAAYPEAEDKQRCDSERRPGYHEHHAAAPLGGRSDTLSIQMHTVSEGRRQRLTRDEQQALTRRRVLEAADTVFAERGFHAARLAEIADRAGYTRGAVYSNFNNKDDLALAIIEQRIRSVTTLLDESVGTTGDPAVQAALAGTRVAHLLGGEPAWGALFLEFATHAARHPELGSRLRELYRGLAGSIAQVLEPFVSQAEGRLPASAERLALTMLAASDGAALERFIDPERADAQLLGDMLGWLVTGLVASQSPSR
jgi:AcrR family transcriptional regulator